jgi:hypothetical protein
MDVNNEDRTPYANVSAEESLGLYTVYKNKLLVGGCYSKAV